MTGFVVFVTCLFYVLLLLLILSDFVRWIVVLGCLVCRLLFVYVRPDWMFAYVWFGDFCCSLFGFCLVCF